ncbi:MAG: 4-hydroxy-tetrahydrodipicolinate synthase [Acholeplasmatales bacterium]|nr:4-hydroxy-tetrahydrodipicolinate synthase [Acholeplasmatales bacterium]
MLRGSLVALVTPFNSDGSVNYDELEGLLEYHCDKSDGIVILGTTGESSTLNFEEEEKIVEFSAKIINKRVPLIVGSGSNETEKAVKMSYKYSRLGADYLLVITPYYNKTNESGLISHFEAIAEASACPIILYNVPSRTGMSIPISAYARLSKNPKIVGVKEASGNMSYTMKITKYLSEDFFLLSGNDDIIVPMMSIGAKGVISVLANVAPVQTKTMCDLCLKGEFKAANKIQVKLLDFINALFIEVNPIPVKAIMSFLGWDTKVYRAPLDAPTEEDYETIVSTYEKLREDIF